MADAVAGSPSQQPGPFSRRARSGNENASPTSVQPTLHSAANLFSQLRHNPHFMNVLWDSRPKRNEEICKKIILQNIFPEDADECGQLDGQFAQLLHSLFQAEVAGCTDLNRVLREDSLACVLAAAYGRRERAQSFARELLEPIFAESLRDSSIRIGSTSESYSLELLDATFKKSIVAICSRIEEFPVGFVFSSSAIVNALKSHPQNIGTSLSATSAVGAVVFLRYIVPFVVQYGQGRQPVAERFFCDLGNVLQKSCSRSTFAPNHKNESLNATLQEVSVNLEEAFARLSSLPPLPASAHQSTSTNATLESPHEVDAEELYLFVSSLSSMKSIAPLPSSVLDSALLQTLDQLQRELSQYAAAKNPPPAQSLPTSVPKHHSGAAPNQSSTIQQLSLIHI